MQCEGCLGTGKVILKSYVKTMDYFDAEISGQNDPKRLVNSNVFASLFR